MEPSRIIRAKNYLKEIKKLVDKPDIRITSEYDLDHLFKAKNYLQDFIEKQKFNNHGQIH